jgi:hypothetical protein
MNFTVELLKSLLCPSKFKGIIIWSMLFNEPTMVLNNGYMGLTARSKL